ncbi:MAG: Holliday junction resolvase RuvX [Steroidobacterales bacterium]
MPEAPATRTAQLVMAFDYGLRRIGVACGDTLSATADPVAAVAAGPAGPQWSAIDMLMRDWQPAFAVVGLPYNVDGTESGMTGAARAFAGELGARYHLRVELTDERYSSLEAQERLRQTRESGARRKRVAKADIDAAAACIILERWISEHS